MKKHKDFIFAYENSQKWHCKCAVIFYFSSPNQLVGFVASKKVGNAVKRAKAKRYLRAIFLDLQNSLKSGIYIFIAKPEILDFSYEENKKYINWAFDKLSCKY